MHLPTQISFYTCLAFQAIAIAHALDDPSRTFRPREYSKQIATCNAKRRAGDSVDIDLHYVDLNPSASTSIIMVHGWPSLWSSWSNQIQEFKNDYHLIVPDLRGFGSSTHPGNSKGSMPDFVSDLVCVLEHAKVKSTICVGHDWGSQICYEAARMRPDVFTAVAATIPYIPSAGPFLSIESLIPALPRLSYQVFFDKQTSAAVAELNKDIRRTARATLRTVNSSPPSRFLESIDTFMGGWSDVAEIPPIAFFTPDEEDYFVEQYAIQGFNNTLQFYIHANRYASWEFSHNQGNHTIPQPVLAILPLNDFVANWEYVSIQLKSASFLPQLTTKTAQGSHWLQLENPTEFNAFLRDWLTSLPNLSLSPSLSSDNVQETKTRISDEF